MSTSHQNPFRRREPIAITPEELGMLYTMSDEEIDRYYDRMYHYLSFLGVPELYRENQDVFDEKLFCKAIHLVESKLR